MFGGLFSSAPKAEGGGAPKPLNVNDLTSEKLASLHALQEQFPEEDQGTLLGFLKVRGFNVKESSQQLQASIEWRKSFGDVSIADIAPFLKSAPGAAGPDGCFFLLEDCNGGVARDTHGRPVCCSIGMMHGSEAEMAKQMVYAMNRAKLYTSPGDIHCSSVVIEIVPRQGCRPTFRFPDANTKAMMELQKKHFPGSLSSTTHMCGVPSIFVWTFSLCKPFMDPEAYANMCVKADYLHLAGEGYLTPENMLKEWGGTLEWDMDKYIAWRAFEEGVQVSDEVRRYDSSAGSDPSASSGSSAESIKQALMMTTSQQLSSGAGGFGTPTKLGPVEKQGSGVGLFANLKWKEKLLSVGPGGMAFYFDSPEISDSNRVSRVIQLDGAAVEAVDDDDSTPASSSSESKSSVPTRRLFKIVTADRNFLFGCRSEEEREQWLAALKQEIEGAVATRQQVTELMQQRHREAVAAGGAGSQTGGNGSGNGNGLGGLFNSYVSTPLTSVLGVWGGSKKHKAQGDTAQDTEE